MLKLAALGALGYAGYRYFKNNNSSGEAFGSSPRKTAVAGGPLSKNATVQHNPDTPPAV